ncbi:MAG: nucleotidyltransferase domain-containing protein [Nanoarchaeota archaeon]
MYDKINITENSLQVLALFTNGFERDYYIREVEKVLDISPRTAQLMLEDLENKGILESKKRGKIKSYTLRLNEHTNRYLLFVEQYKALAFLEKSLIVKEMIEKITPYIQGVGVIFGSYAKGLENKESDLDVFIAGSYNKEEVKKVSKNFGINISVKCYPMKVFEKNVGKDILLKEIAKTHIIIANGEKFIEVMVKHA